MTYAPSSLIALGKFLNAHDVVNLGIVGDQSHQATGTSYHLGKDHLIPGAYSAVLPRDKAGLTNAASAIDIGKFDGSYVGLRTFSTWLVARCNAKDPGTEDIREVIFSPDGHKVQRWDNNTRRLYLGGDGTNQGDNSHLWHTHVSYWRDSEGRDKINLIGRYFGIAPSEADMTPTRVVTQRWKANGTDGVLRSQPNRSLAPSVRLSAGTEVESYAEFTDASGNNWRLTEYPKGSGTPAYFLRTGPGVPKDHDFIAGDFGTAVDEQAIAAKAIAAFKARINNLS